MVAKMTVVECPETPESTRGSLDYCKVLQLQLVAMVNLPGHGSKW